MKHRRAIWLVLVTVACGLTVLWTSPVGAVETLSESEMRCILGGNEEGKCGPLYYQGPLCPVNTSCHEIAPTPIYAKDQFLASRILCQAGTGDCVYPNLTVKDDHCDEAGQRPCVWTKAYAGDNYCSEANRDPNLDEWTCGNSCK